MSAAPAASSWLLSVVPSIEAMMSASAPLLIIASICCCWVGMSSFANWMSTSYPASSSPVLTASPSATQRS